MEQEISMALREQMEKLPPEVQRAVTSPDLRKKIKEIGDRNKLHIDQIGLLEDETVLVMIGLEEPADFTDNIASHVRMEKEVAQRVSGEVSEKVFIPIRDAMKKFMSEEPKIVGSQEGIDSSTSTTTLASAPSTSKLPPLEPRSSTPQAIPNTTFPPTPPTPHPLPPAPQIEKSVTPSSTPTPLNPAAGSGERSENQNVLAKPPMPISPNLHPTEIMLSEKTTQVPTSPQATKGAEPKPQAPVPQPYKKDPYREPAE
jgi:hypothetical protein